MRILIEPGSYTSLNMGDVAMFLETVARLEHLWPEAELATFTSDPARLRRYAPRVVPYPVEARKSLLATRPVPLVTRLRLGIGLVRPAGIRRILAARPRPGACGLPDIRSFSLLAVSGAGGLCDPFLRHAWSTLELLDIAVSAGIPTALFSQGVGPMKSTILRAKARAVLPRVDLIALRERREGPRVLRELGVPADRVHISGDDAVDRAYRVRRPSFGDCLGINLRLAGYAKVNRALAASILGTVGEFVRRRAVKVLPIPISFQDGEADSDAVSELPGVADALPCPDYPEEVARRAGRCRLMVTGSYHAAVFALAQGVPVVAVSNSLYYDDKFLGLAEMFGAGCRVVRLSNGDPVQRLGAELENLWTYGERRREGLLRSARGQIGRSEAAYWKAFEIVSARRAQELSPELEPDFPASCNRIFASS